MQIVITEGVVDNPNLLPEPVAEAGIIETSSNKPESSQSSSKEARDISVIDVKPGPKKVKKGYLIYFSRRKGKKKLVAHTQNIYSLKKSWKQVIRNIYAY